MKNSRLISFALFLATASSTSSYLTEYGKKGVSECSPYERVCGAFPRDKKSVGDMPTDNALHTLSVSAPYNKYEKLATDFSSSGNALADAMRKCMAGASPSRMREYLEFLSCNVDFSTKAATSRTLAQDLVGVFVEMYAMSGMKSIAHKTIYISSGMNRGFPLQGSNSPGFKNYGRLNTDGVFVEKRGARGNLTVLMRTLIDGFGARKFFNGLNTQTLTAIQNVEFLMAKCSAIDYDSVTLDEDKVPGAKRFFPVDFDQFLGEARQFARASGLGDVCPSGARTDCFKNFVTFSIGYFKCLRDEVFAKEAPENIKMFYLWYALFSKADLFATDDIFRQWRLVSGDSPSVYMNRTESCLPDAIGYFPYHYVQNVMRAGEFEALTKNLQRNFNVIKAGLMQQIKSWKLPRAEDNEFVARVNRLQFKGISMYGADFKLSDQDLAKPQGAYTAVLFNITQYQVTQFEDLREGGQPNDDFWSPFVKFPIEYAIASHAYHYDPLVMMHQMSTLMTRQSISLAALSYDLDYEITLPRSSPVSLFNCAFNQYQKLVNRTLDSDRSSFITYRSNLGTENIALRATWNAYSQITGSPSKSAFLDNYAYAMCGHTTYMPDLVAELQPSVVRFAINGFLKDFGAIGRCPPLPNDLRKCLPRPLT